MIVERIIDIFIAVIIFFLLPFIYVQMKQTEYLQEYFLERTAIFLEQIQNSGILCTDDYQNYQEMLSSNAFFIRAELQISRYEYLPGEQEDNGSYYAKKIFVQYSDYEIRNNLELNEKLILRDQDFVKIRVYQAIPFVFRFFDSCNTSNRREWLMINYGGII